jgi:hypothetical protein
MEQQTAPSFAHRTNRDGIHDSICRGCFQTVASAINEPELAQDELVHVCDPFWLHRVCKN